MKRKLIAWALLASILLPITLFAAGDKQTKNTVPSASVSFLSDLQTFLKEENAERYADLFTGMVVSNGYHGTVAGLTGNPGAFTGYPGGFLTTETATITYPDADRCWVIAHSLR